MADHQLLTAEAHRDLRIDIGRGARLGDAVMSCVTVPSEFRRVQDEFPILFRLNTTRDAFSALAMFGFEAGENLFLDGDRWDARYVPLALAIQPFLIGGEGPHSADKQVHIDMTSPRTGSGNGMRLFDEDGRATPYLDDIAGKLGELDEGYQAAAGFFTALVQHDLLEPLTVEITLDDGSINRFVGFHVINEDRLQTLDGAALGALHQQGYLLPIFMAVASLGRINELIARKNRRVARV